MSQEEDTSDLVQVLGDACELLAKQDISLQAISVGNRRFIGVRNDRRHGFDLAELRHTIHENCEIRGSSNTTVQVVGDSGTAFDNAKILSAQQALARSVEGDVLIEYGFTSIEHDANWLVQDYVSSRPEAAARTVANLVGQSLQALRSTTWTGSEHVRTFVVLYDKDGTPTRFGRDTWVSDGVMSREAGDRMLCFEGGAQAFHQCVNALLAGIGVLAMTDLRPTSDERRFSAARLLLAFARTDDDVESDQRLEDCLHACPPKTKEQLLAIHKDLARLRAANTAVAQLIGTV
ncbi:hypothetical protein LTR70_003110 [Exophiala xenobiotica]|uniref:Uncharacterized protein n=1 Tax=Lithohypha guttulata TaxID=1690604 RepID=A0ABR0KJ86_9EURO|nr:hypothetical protein LTR24_002657 [Lithohypha guttulata]KAK5323821.1 hypothetical protein LTR70_003110 [Exophiala xenobiotica]